MCHLHSPALRFPEPFASRQRGYHRHRYTPTDTNHTPCSPSYKLHDAFSLCCLVNFNSLTFVRNCVYDILYVLHDAYGIFMHCTFAPSALGLVVKVSGCESRGSEFNSRRQQPIYLIATGYWARLLKTQASPALYSISDIYYLIVRQDGQDRKSGSNQYINILYKGYDSAVYEHEDAHIVWKDRLYPLSYSTTKQATSKTEKCRQIKSNSEKDENKKNMPEPTQTTAHSSVRSQMTSSAAETETYYY